MITQHDIFIAVLCAQALWSGTVFMATWTVMRVMRSRKAAPTAATSPSFILPMASGGMLIVTPPRDPNAEQRAELVIMLRALASDIEELHQ